MAIDNVAMGTTGIARPYILTAFSQGMTASDFQTIVHQGHGERVRWWKAVGTNNASLSRDGVKYIEQRLNASVRVLLSENDLEFDLPDFGKIRIGNLKKSSLPDEIEMALYDRILAIDRPRIATTNIKPSGNTTDNLPHLFVRSIDLIVDSTGAVMDALKYELYGRAIRWRGAIPTQKFTVRYRYYPQFEFRGEGDKQAQLGADGLRLPQIIPLHLVAAGDERDS